MFMIFKLNKINIKENHKYKFIRLIWKNKL